jgi:hypothetical protein
MNATTPSVDRRAQSRRNRSLQDVVRSAQLADLALELGDPLLVGRRGSLPATGVDLGLLQPATQRLGPNTELPGHAGDHTETLATLRVDQPLRHAHRALAQLRRIPPLRPVLSHAPSSLPRYGASGDPRPIHCTEDRAAATARSGQSVRASRHLPAFVRSRPDWRLAGQGLLIGSHAVVSERRVPSPRTSSQVFRSCHARRTLASSPGSNPTRSSRSGLVRIHPSVSRAVSLSGLVRRPVRSARETSRVMNPA